MSRPSSHFLEAEAREFLGVRTNHEWRKKKRAELRAVEQAVETYHGGSAYTPHSSLATPPGKMSLLELVRYMRRQLSVNNWGK